MIATNDARDLDNIEVTISLATDKTRPQEILIRVRLPDRSVTALMADGSVQALPR